MVLRPGSVRTDFGAISVTDLPFRVLGLGPYIIITKYTCGYKPTLYVDCAEYKCM